MSAESELLTAIVASTRDRLQAAACSVALVEDGELVFRAASGAGAAEILGVRLPIGRGIAGWVVTSGQAIAVSDVHRDQRFDAETAQSTGYLPTSILAVPVEDDEGPIGVLEVLDRTSETHDLDVAGDAARQIGLVVELTRNGAEVDAVLADPALRDLIALVRRLGAADERDRALAVALLSAVVEQRSPAR